VWKDYLSTVIPAPVSTVTVDSKVCGVGVVGCVLESSASVVISVLGAMALVTVTQSFERGRACKAGKLQVGNEASEWSILSRGQQDITHMISAVEDGLIAQGLVALKVVRNDHN